MIRPISNNLILELHVPTFQPVRKFYGLFGFTELSYEPTSGGGNDLGYLVLIRHDAMGDTLLSFYGDKNKVTEQAHFKDFPASTPRGYAVEITIPVSDVRGLWDQVAGKLSADIISQPLATEPWGKQDFRVIDPFGFYVRFTEPVDWGQK